MALRVISIIKGSYDRLPRQMKVAARWLIEHPTEVALLSMREQARRARVPPATLTRLAKRLGFNGFDKLKEVFADDVRGQPQSFAKPAGGLHTERIDGDTVIITNTVKALHDHLDRLARAPAVAMLAAAAEIMLDARQIFCIARRSSFPVVHLVHHVGCQLGCPTRLVDEIGGIANDALHSIGPEDVLLAVTVSPYARFTMQAAEFAVSRGAKLVAITDSELSPIANLTRTVILVRTEMPSFGHTATPAFAAAECLLELVAARRGNGRINAMEANDDNLTEADTCIPKLPTIRNL